MNKNETDFLNSFNTVEDMFTSSEDIMSDPFANRVDINAEIEAGDYDPDDEYHNEMEQSGIHPDYEAFDDPDEDDYSEWDD